jgi:hypothetical protein
LHCKKKEAISRYDNISEVAFFLFWWCFGGVFLRLEPMKRMTPATTLLLRTLIGKYTYFAKRRMLAENGSFYCYDQNLIRELSISRNTIRRARIFLKETGAIATILPVNIRARLRITGLSQRDSEWSPLNRD